MKPPRRNQVNLQKVTRRPCDKQKNLSRRLLMNYLNDSAKQRFLRGPFADVALPHWGTRHYRKSDVAGWISTGLEAHHWNQKVDGQSMSLEHTHGRDLRNKFGSQVWSSIGEWTENVLDLSHKEFAKVLKQHRKRLMFRENQARRFLQKWVNNFDQRSMLTALRDLRLQKVCLCITIPRLRSDK